MRTALALATLALAASTSGCAAALFGVGAGVVLSQEVTENQTHVAHLNEDPARVWVVTKSALSHMASEPIHVDEDLRRASGKVDGSTVTISVETYDQNRSLLRVGARRYGVVNGEAAELALNRVISRLTE